MFSSRTILRYNSLSSLPSLCRTRPPLAWRALLSTTATASPTTLQDLATRFRERIWHCSALSLAPTYDIHFTYSLLTRSDLYNALDVLATSAKGDDFLLIKDLLEDMPTYFGQAVTIDTHRMVIRALVDSDNTRALLRWLTTMRTESGGVQPTLEFWHMFMDHCLLHSDIRTMSQGIRTMQSQGLPANNATYKFLARKMFMASSHHFLWAIRIINRISRTKLPFDDALLASCWKALMALAPFPSRSRRSSLPSRYLDDQQVSRVQSGLDFNARLAQAYLRDGQVVAVDLYRSFRERGFQPSQAL
ncbi:hypothetical protein BC834DRAFT_965459 [Gloeopeniophorella convolvens]|nr:hypothetical protein BC834DRAFT_965459 [Gloeopeniophorella convolvens]